MAYYFGQKLLLRDVIAGFAKSLGLKVESLDFWLYREWFYVT